MPGWVSTSKHLAGMLARVSTSKHSAGMILELTAIGWESLILTVFGWYDSQADGVPLVIVLSSIRTCLTRMLAGCQSVSVRLV
jgi:hypothetical protein